MLNKEDKKDVKTHMGKALANKVHKATDDSLKPGDIFTPDTKKGFAYSNKKAKSEKQIQRSMASDAKKALYDMGAKNVGKEAAIKGMKQAFGSRETRAKAEKERGVLPGNRSTSAYEGPRHVNRQ